MRNIVWILFFLPALFHAQDLDKLRDGYYKVGDTVGDFKAIKPVTYFRTIDKSLKLNYNRNLRKGDTIEMRIRITDLKPTGYYFFSPKGYADSFGFSNSSNGLSIGSRDKSYTLIAPKLKMNQWSIVKAIARKNIRVKDLKIGYNLIGSIDIDYIKIPHSYINFNDTKDVEDDGGTMITAKNVVLERQLKGYVTPEIFEGDLKKCFESNYTCKLRDTTYSTSGNFQLKKGKIIDGNGATINLVENNNFLTIQASFFTIRDLTIKTDAHNKSVFVLDQNFGVKHGVFENVNVMGKKDVLARTGMGSKAFTFGTKSSVPKEILDIRFENVKVFYCAEAINIPKPDIPFTVNTLIFDHLLSWGNKRTMNIHHGDIYRGHIVVQDDEILNNKEKGIAIFTIRNSRRSYIEYMVFDMFVPKKSNLNRHRGNLFDIKNTDATFKFKNIYYDK